MVHMRIARSLYITASTKIELSSSELQPSIKDNPRDWGKPSVRSPFLFGCNKILVEKNNRTDFQTQLLTPHATQAVRSLSHAVAVPPSVALAVSLCGFPCTAPPCGNDLSISISGSVRIFTSVSSFFPNENARDRCNQTSFLFFR